MDSEYLDILREWERNVGRPALYANLDRVFPEYDFRRLQKGTARDHWGSRYKIDLSLPKRRNAEKTVVYESDMRMREQGEWNDGVDLIQKLMQDRGFSSVRDAFAYLDSLFSLGMPQPDSREVQAYRQRKARNRELLNALQDYFQASLWDKSSRNAGKVRSYLSTKRDFSREDGLRLGFGFVPSWNVVVHHFVTQLGYSLSELDEVCGVRNAEGKTAVGSIFTLSIPYRTAGEIRGFIFRRVGESDGPKYMANRGLDRKSRFFNIPSALPGKEIVVVEGEFDALKAESAGLGCPVVAIGGSEIAGERRRQIEDALSRGVESVKAGFLYKVCRVK